MLCNSPATIKRTAANYWSEHRCLRLNINEYINRNEENSSIVFGFLFLLKNSEKIELIGKLSLTERINMREAEWLSQYDVLKHKIRTRRQSGNPCPQTEIKDLTNGIDFLSKNLKTMQAAPMEYEVSSSELARREVVTDNLRKQITMIPLSGAKLGTSPTFGIEMEAPSTSTGGQRASETMNPMNTSDRGLVQRQRDIIQQQDQMLEQISQGVDVLHHQAIHIGEEAKVHSQILGQLDTQVDRAADQLKAEAKHADEVRIRSNVCGMYICVFVEVVIIVILLIAWLAPIKT